eukprot:TRINITY_DN26486_c0_g1_i1.p1 TRINITY_DN26486_c0_g1~~TRINITY_DN26486_c0_g1_i1.p1  ORF type:complete len:590 (+),score=129.61 TRINITY_DN26486_c0_g1_i1:37-1806(+)
MGQTPTSACHERGETTPQGTWSPCGRLHISEPEATPPCSHLEHGRTPRNAFCMTPCRNRRLPAQPEAPADVQLPSSDTPGHDGSSTVRSEPRLQPSDMTPGHDGSSTIRSAIRSGRSRGQHHRVSFNLTDPHLLEVDVSTAETLLTSAMKGLQDLSPEALQVRNFRVSFRGQPGQDEGGVRRDFFARIGLVLQKPESGLFLAAPGGRMQLRPACPAIDCGMREAPKGWWSCLGSLLAAAVLHGEPLGLNLVPSVCKQLLGVTPDFEDLEAVRPADFRALRSLRRQQVTAVKAEEGLLVLQLAGSHGACPGDSVFIKGGSDIAGEYVVQQAPTLDSFQLAIPWDADTPPPPEPGVLCRYRTEEDGLNDVLEVLGCTVPSRVAIIREALQANQANQADGDEEAAASNYRSGVYGVCEELSTGNFEQYIREAAEKLLRRNLEPHLTALKESFQQGLGSAAEAWTGERWRELQCLLCGELTIDLEAWRAASVSEGFEPDMESQILDWWFGILSAGSSKLRCEVLTWCTGWAALPSGGWPRNTTFVLRKSPQQAEFLPQAHLCNFTVDIPQYTSKEQLEIKLLQAIKERDFGIA